MKHFIHQLFRLLSIITLLTTSTITFGQISPGDIAIIGINADDTFPNQRWAFVVLADIPASTVIHFTDAGITNTGVFNVNAVNEGHMTWTTPSKITAGTVFFCTNSGISGQTVTGSLGGTTNGFPGTGDQIIVYTGTSGTTTGATFIYALNTGQSSTNYPSLGSWQTTTTNTGDNLSYAPPGLASTNEAVLTSNSSTGFLSSGTGASGSANYGFDNMYYAGTTSGTKTSILAAIANPSNWLGDNSTAWNLSSGGVFPATFTLPSAPTVTTTAQSGVSTTSATLGGNVTADGGASVTDRGIVWSTSSNPTTADNKVGNGSGTGSFSASVPGLPQGATVYVKAYAINSVNTGYGNQISFSTNTVVSSISRAGSTPTNAGTVSYNVVFAQSVTGVDVSDFSLTTTGVSSTSISSVSGSGTNWTITVGTGTGSGTIRLDFTGTSGVTPNVNAAFTSGEVYTIDKTAPTVAISSSASNPTNASPITVNFNFSESVTGFVIGDITVAGGTKSNFTGSGSSYSVDITPTADGTITVDVAAAVATDAAGNGNTAATQFSIVSDRSVPNVTISSTSASPTNASPITVNFTFSKSVTGFTIGDITVAGGTKSNFTGSGSSYSVDVTPSADGTITVDVAAGVAVDVFSNPNTAATQFSIVSDRTAPTVTITSVTSSPTNASPITVNFTFNENVTGFVIGDITVAGATKSNFTGSGSSYSVDITPTADGTITVNVAGNVANDAAGNGNTAATQFSIVSDRTAPTVTITSTSTSPTSNSPITVNFTFSENVTGFAIGDITVAGGTKSNFTGSGSSYSVDVTPTADGTITVNVAAGVATDAVGNNNTAATQFSIVSDRTAPTVVISSTSTSPTNANPIVVNFTFNESVTGFTIGDITVAGGTKGNFTGSGSSYSVEVTPTADGTITVDVAAGVANDLAGNPNTAATQFSIVSDRTAPTVTITSVTTSPTNASPITVNFTFSKNVTGFVIGDITVAGATKSNFTGSGSSYSVDITPTADGTITVNVAGNVANDAAGNGNTAATQFSIVSDRTAPTVTITSTSTSPTSNSPITVNFTFSENVTGFAIGDITVAGGTKSNFTGSGSSYSVDVTPTADGTITVDVAAGVATDAVGNNNTAATQFSIVSDKTSPTVVISSTSTSPTNANPIVVNFTFNESVTGFAIGDITVAGGTKGNFTGSGSSYSVEVTPTADGTITVDVAAGVANDLAGNPNTAATQFSIVSDRTAPTVTITSVTTSPTNASPITVNFTFSKNVTGFVIGDITVAGATKSNFTGSGSSYSVDITPTADGTITVNVAGNVANDAAGNGNTAATQFSIVSDRTAPTVAITSTSTSPTSNSPITVNFTFSENVTGFAIGDITVAGGTKSNFTGSGSSYSVDVTPTADGTITVDVAAGVATDAVGNNNTAATQFSIVSDRTAPTVVISSTSTSPTNANPIVININFNKNVTGFVIGDITVAGGTKGNFTGSGSSYSVEVTPTADGTITVDVAAGVANDLSGNPNTAATQFSIVSDRTAPVATITSTSTSPTNASPIVVNINFSKNVTGFVIGDIIVAGGTKSNFTGSGSSYSVNITPSADGTITVDVGAGAANDAAGNGNPAATQFSIVSDRTIPTVTIASASASPTNASPVTVNFTFSKSVTGFAIGDITVAGGSKSNFTGSGTSYSVDITPSGDGTITVDVAAGVATDGTGNGNAAATQFSIVSDRTAPTVAISSTSTSPTNASPIVVNFTFSESVTGFTIGDITVAGGTKGNFTGSGSNYSVEITPGGDGTITVNVGAGVANDLAGNGNTAATQFSIVSDMTAPTVVISSTSTSPTNASPITVNFTFSENVTGFAVGDITVAGGTKSNFTGSGSSYSVDITPAADGTITVNVGGNAANDAAGNGNTEATQFSIVSERTNPSVSVSSTSTSPTNTSPITVNFTFSKNVTGFVIGDITVAGGSKSNFTGSGSGYSVDVTPTGDGTITVDVAANVANDGANNGNTAATQFSIVSDRTAPTVAISSTSTSPTNASPIVVNFTFSESVTGFAIGDITVAGGTKGNFTGSGSNYSVEITPGGDGTITVNVGAGVANDLAGNGNTAATQFSIVSDRTKPGVTIASTSSNPTSTSPIPLTFVFSKSVSDFTNGDVVVSGGSLSNFTGSGTNYSADLLPSINGTITVDVPANIAVDGSGNNNTAATQFSIQYVNNPPVLITSGGPTAFIQGTTPSVVIDPGVTVSDIDDLTLRSGTVSIAVNFQSGEDVLSFDYDAGTMGNITGSYSAGVMSLSSASPYATVAQWQAAFRAVKYSNTSATPNTGSRTTSFVVNDGQNNSTAYGKIITITPKPIITVAAILVVSGTKGTLEATGCTGGTVNWFGSSSTADLTVLGTGVTFQSPDPVTAAISFYAQCTIGLAVSDRTEGKITLRDCSGLIASAGPGGTFTGLETYKLTGVTTASGGTTPYTYEWTTSPVVSIDDATIANPEVGPFTQNTTVNIKVTDDFGCSSTSSVVVNYDECRLSATITGNGDLCSSSQVTLTVNVTGAKNPVSYLWCDNSTGSSLVVTTPNTYCLKVTDASGCTHFEQVVVTKTALSTPTIAVVGGTNPLIGPGSVILEADCDGNSVNWFDANNNLLPNVSLNSFRYETVILSSSTTFYAECNKSTCTSSRGSIYITVIPLPDAPTLDAPILCDWGKPTVNATGCAGTVNWYWWASGGNPIATGNAFMSPDVFKTSDYVYADCEVGGIHSLRVRTLVTISPLPEASIKVMSGKVAFCAGDATTLIGNNDREVKGYQWKKDGQILGGRTNRELGVSESGRYSVITFSDRCQRESESVMITAVPLPSAPVIVPKSSLSFCQGLSVQLVAQTQGDFSELRWYKEGTNVGYQKEYWAEISGRYSLRATNYLGCVSPESGSVFVNVLPNPAKPKIYADGKTTVCEDVKINLTISTDPAFRYSWSRQDGKTYATQFIAGITERGVYDLVVTDNNGCNSPKATLEVIVHKLPDAPIIKASGPTEFCEGSSVDLTANVIETPTSQIISYEWKTGEKGTGFKTIKALQGSSSTRKYAVRATDQVGCVSLYSEEILIKVNPNPAKPSISANAPLTYCDNNLTTLTATKATKYLWSSGETTQSIKPGISGNYGLTVENDFGCKSPQSDILTVKVNLSPNIPAIKADGLLEFCDGNKVELTASSDPAYKSYLWNTAGGSAVTPKIVVQKTGTYVVSVKNEVGCSAESVPVSVKVNALPQKPVISANGNTTFCDGGQVTLSVANAQKYTWNTNASSQTLLVKNSGKFAVIVTNEFGCNSLPSDTLSVTVNPNPAKPSVSAQSSTTFCADSKVTLTSSTEFGYRWSNGETSQSVDLNKTGMFTVKVINQFNCISVSSDVIATRALDLPETPTVSKTGVFNLEANSFGLGDGYEWKLAGKLIADTASIIKASSNGNYSVRKKKVYVVNQANMVCYSASVERTFKAEEAYNGLGVYPNPVSGDKLFIETQYNLENATVTIYDRMGAPIFTGNITLLDGRYYININTLNDGLYLLRVSSSNFDSSKWVSVKR